MWLPEAYLVLSKFEHRTSGLPSVNFINDVKVENGGEITLCVIYKRL